MRSPRLHTSPQPVALKSSTLLVLSILLAAMTFGTGCSDEAPAASGQIAMDNNNSAPNNNPAPNNSDNNSVMAPSTLAHESDQTIGVAANSVVELKVRYQDGEGARLSDRPIRWTIIGNSAGSALEVSQSNTDTQGVAAVSITSQSEEATFEVEATAGDDDQVAPIRFTVSVESKQFASYSVRDNYDGVRDYARNEIKVSLYEAPESCAEFNPLAPGTAEQSQKRVPDAQGFPMNFTFTNLRNGTRYIAVSTAFAVEDGQDRVIGSWGCNDERPEITNGVNPPPLEVDLLDVLPDVTGTWNINSRFNLGEALPQNIRQIVDPILNLFLDPTGYLPELLVGFIEEQFNLDVEQIRTVVEGIVEDLLEAAIGGNDTVESVLVGGGDIAESIRNFNLIGSVVIEEGDVSDSGLIEGAELVYNRLGYRWRLNCDSDEDYDADPSCGDSFIELGNFGNGSIEFIEGEWNGAVLPNNDYAPASGRAWFHQLSVDNHTVDLNYGAIILFMIENIALPLLFPAEDGQPAVTSLGALLDRFVQCQERFDSNTLQNVCEAAIDAASDLARGQLADLELQPDNFTIGTPDTAACGLYEQQENYGSPAPNTAHYPRFNRMGLEEEDNTDFGDLRCEWGATIQWSADPQDQSNSSGRWFGTRSSGF